MKRSVAGASQGLREDLDATAVGSVALSLNLTVFPDCGIVASHGLCSARRYCTAHTARHEPDTVGVSHDEAGKKGE